MSFEEYWAEVEKLRVLPNTAIEQLPGVLSESIKEKLKKKRPDETVEILKAVIAEVDHGSIESVDSLLKKKLGVWNAKTMG